MKWLPVSVVIALALAGCIQGGALESGEERDQQPTWRGLPDVGVLAVMGEPSGDERWPSLVDAKAFAGDLDGDGSPEFAYPSKDREVRVFNAEGVLVAQVPMRLPPSWHVDNIINAVTSATLTPGGPPSMIVSTPAGGIQAWRFDGYDEDGGYLFSNEWDMRVDGCHPSPGMDATPAVMDVDGDGADELFTQVEQQGLFAIDDDGSIMWSHCWAGGNGSPAVDDLDGDGDYEVVFAGDDGFISVFDAATGSVQWTFDTRDRTGIMPASVPAAPTIADIDGQLPKEVLFTARHAPNNDQTQFGSFHMAIFAVHQNLSTWQSELVWMQQPEWAHPMSDTRLVVEDVDGDGRGDIFGMDWNTIGHRPGNWEVLGDAHVFRLDAEGNDVWVRDIESWWSNKDILLIDADGDGGLEILANGASGGKDGLWRIDVDDGQTEGFLHAAGYRVARGPVAAIADGRLVLALTVVDADDAPRGAALLYDLVAREQVLA